MTDYLLAQQRAVASDHPFRSGSGSERKVRPRLWRLAAYLRA